MCASENEVIDIADKTPEPGELVVIQISKILPYGAFCRITDYNNLEAFLHISEVSSGWVKNIHEYIEEGRKYVAKIYRVNQEKMMFDVSLKRVSDKEKKDKLDHERREKKATKLIEIVSRKCGLSFPELSSKLLSDYGSLSEFINELEENEVSHFGQNYNEKFLASLKSLLKTSTEKKEVAVSKTIELIGKGNNGIEMVKSAFGSIATDNLEVKYLSSPRYMLKIRAPTHKEASKALLAVVSKLKEDKNILVNVSDDQEN